MRLFEWLFYAWVGDSEYVMEGLLDWYGYDLLVGLIWWLGSQLWHID